MADAMPDKDMAEIWMQMQPPLKKLPVTEYGMPLLFSFFSFFSSLPSFLLSLPFTSCLTSYILHGYSRILFPDDSGCRRELRRAAAGQDQAEHESYSYCDRTLLRQVQSLERAIALLLPTSGLVLEDTSSDRNWGLGRKVII